MSSGARDTWIATGTALVCTALLAGVLACSLLPAAVNVDQTRLHDDATIDACQEVSRAVYRHDAGREAGLAAFDDCIREAGL